jgi:hypothetical protein
VAATVAAVEQMQERTGEEQQVGDGAQDMGSVLGHDEEGRGGEESEQHHARP